MAKSRYYTPAAPLSAPLKAVSILDVKKAKSMALGRELAKGFGDTWETAKKWVILALANGVVACFLGVISVHSMNARCEDVDTDTSVFALSLCIIPDAWGIHKNDHRGR